MASIGRIQLRFYLYIFLTTFLASASTLTSNFSALRERDPNSNGYKCNVDLISNENIIESGKEACAKLSACPSQYKYPLPYEGNLFARGLHPLYAYPILAETKYIKGRSGPHRIIFDQQCFLIGVITAVETHRPSLCTRLGVPITQDFSSLGPIETPGFRCANEFYEKQVVQHIANIVCERAKRISVKRNRNNPQLFLMANFPGKGVILWPFLRTLRGYQSGRKGPLRIAMDGDCNAIALVSVINDNYSKCITYDDV